MAICYACGDIPTELNIAAVIAYIAWSQAEANTLLQKGFKLNAGTWKFCRERTTVLSSSGAATLVAGAAIGDLLVEFLQWTGNRPVASTGC